MLGLHPLPSRESCSREHLTFIAAVKLLCSPVEAAQPSRAHSSGSPGEAAFSAPFKKKKKNNGASPFVSAGSAFCSANTTTKLTHTALAWAELFLLLCITCPQNHHGSTWQSVEASGVQLRLGQLFKNVLALSTSTPVLIHLLSETILFLVSPKDHRILIKKEQGQLFLSNIRSMT